MASLACGWGRWLESYGNEVFAKRIIETMVDGDVDVVIASRHDNTSAWNENDGAGSIINHTIDISAPSACTIIGIDIETLCASVGNDTIPRYINNGNGGHTKQGNDLAVAGADGIFAIDMDNEQCQRSCASCSIGAYLEIVINNSIHHSVDANIGSMNMNLVYTIANALALEQQWVDGSPIFAGCTFTQNDIDNDQMIYVHEGTTFCDGFSFTVEDGGVSGVLPAAGTFTITISESQSMLRLRKGENDH